MFGATVGGPVKKDEAFFFFSYGGLRQVVGTPLSGGIVPTAAQRSGDFTLLSTPIFYPGTKTQIVGTNSAPACSSPTPNCIPTSLLDKTAASLLKYVPLPTSANGSYVGYFNGPTLQNEYLGKFDGAFGARDHVSASFFYLNTEQDSYGGGNVAYVDNQSYGRQYVSNLSDVHTMTANTANQAWLTFTRVAGGAYKSAGARSRSAGIEVHNPRSAEFARASRFRVLQCGWRSRRPRQRH